MSMLSFIEEITSLALPAVQGWDLGKNKWNAGLKYLAASPLQAPDGQYHGRPRCN